MNIENYQANIHCASCPAHVTQTIEYVEIGTQFILLYQHTFYYTCVIMLHALNVTTYYNIVKKYPNVNKIAKFRCE